MAWAASLHSLNLLARAPYSLLSFLMAFMWLTFCSFTPCIIEAMTVFMLACRSASSTCDSHSFSSHAFC